MRALLQGRTAYSDASAVFARNGATDLRSSVRFTMPAHHNKETPQKNGAGVSRLGSAGTGEVGADAGLRRRQLDLAYGSLGVDAGESEYEVAAAGAGALVAVSAATPNTSEIYSLSLFRAKAISISTHAGAQLPLAPLSSAFRLPRAACSAQASASFDGGFLSKMKVRTSLPPCASRPLPPPCVSSQRSRARLAPRKREVGRSKQQSLRRRL